MSKTKGWLLSGSWFSTVSGGLVCALLALSSFILKAAEKVELAPDAASPMLLRWEGVSGLCVCRGRLTAALPVSSTFLC